MTRNVKHTHLGREVRYPAGARPGDRITWHEDAAEGQCRPPYYGGEPRRTRAGVVIDRAANGVGDGCEAPGYWLWVMPDEYDGHLVRVRTWASGRRKGEAWRDDGPMYVESSLGMDEIHHRGHRWSVYDYRGGRGPCKCCRDEQASA